MIANKEAQTILSEMTYNFPKTHTGTNTTVEAAPTLQDRLSKLLKKRKHPLQIKKKLI